MEQTNLLRLVCRVTTFCGLFPYDITVTSQPLRYAVKFRPIYCLFLFIPITLLVHNVFFISPKSSMNGENGEHSTSTVMLLCTLRGLLHLDLLICLLASNFFYKYSISKMFEFYLNQESSNVSQDEAGTTNTVRTCSIILIAFALYNVVGCVNAAKLDMLTDRWMIGLHMEVAILHFHDIQLCVLLSIVKNSFVRFISNIQLSNVGSVGLIVSEQEPASIPVYYARELEAYGPKIYKDSTDVDEWRKLEKFRLSYMKMWVMIDSLNRRYSVGNLVLTIRERCAFAIFLYLWLQDTNIGSLLFAIVNFVRFFLVIYYFQMVKNQEKSLRIAICELRADEKFISLPATSRFQCDLFEKQIISLPIKFDAGLGMFPMDFTTVIYIITTTAGYLLLLSQLS